MINIIFLDIDEVMNNVSNTIRCRQHKIAAHQFQGFNPISVALLRELVELTDAKIVLSSTWRMHYKTDEECINDWEAQMEKWYDWKEFPIIGRTSNGWQKPGSKLSARKWSIRGEEIQQWLELHAWDQYVIIDDSSDMLPSQKKNFVKVKYTDGFNFSNFQSCLKIFLPDEKRYLLMK